MAAPLVQHCLPQDFDAALQTCAAPYWSAVGSAFPVLSVADAVDLGWTFAWLYAIAWGFRMIRKTINETA